VVTVSQGDFGLGADRGYADWSSRMFHALTIGGVWGIPRSGLVFTRVNENTLALTDVMPYDPDMPVTARELFDQQAGDFQAVALYMKQAGIVVYDKTETFD
jgi:hypothetical protein